MEYYTLIKHIHVSAAVLSATGFLLRGYWMLTGNPKLNSKAARVLPHIIDSLLLIAGIYLVVVSNLYLGSWQWLGFKLALLVVYIVAGTIALKRGKTRKIRIAALVVALLSVISIFVVAVLKP